MDKSVDAVSCEPMAWGNCLVSATALARLQCGGQTLRTLRVWLPTVFLALWTQYGTFVFAHFPQVPVTWVSMFTNGAKMFPGHWPLAPCFSLFVCFCFK
jgi:hypothetical protein